MKKLEKLHDNENNKTHGGEHNLNKSDIAERIQFPLKGSIESNN